MQPEIALNRWLTCVCTVSATKKITVRGRWKCPWCRPALMSGFPLSFSPLLLRFFRVIPCTRELSIPASRDWGPCCALWWRWCPPSSYSSLPVSSVRPALLFLAGLKPWNSRKATSSRPDRRNHNSVSAWISPCNQPTYTRSRAHLINPSLAAVTKAGFLWEWHMHTNARFSQTHTPLGVFLPPPPALRGFTGPICRLTWLELTSQLADTLSSSPVSLKAQSTLRDNMERGQSYESYFLMSVWPKQRPKLLLPGGIISLLCSCHWSGWLVICKPDTKAGGHGVTVGNNERERESMRVCPGAGNIRLSLLVRMVPRAHGALIPFSLSTHFDQHSFFFQYHIYVWEYSECFFASLLSSPECSVSPLSFVVSHWFLSSSFKPLQSTEHFKAQLGRTVLTVLLRPVNRNDLSFKLN